MNRKLKNEELGRVSAKEFKQAEKHPLIIVLDNVRSAYNVGSVFRTADAFALQAVYLCGITAKPPNKEIRKTALGADESVEWKYFKSTLEAMDELRINSYQILSVEQAEKSIPLNEFHPKKKDKYALVFGHEVNGVLQEIVNISDVVLEIPQFGTKHSLNIAVSTGVVVWDLVQKLQQ